MGRLGYGFPAGRRRRLVEEYQALELTTYEIEASPQWDGTRGSGFASIPSDPARLTAKPAVRLLVPDHQYFADSIEIGVAAYANNRGSMLENCGLRKVVFHFEGSSVEAERPNLRSFTRIDGTTYSVLGWWVTLKRTASTSGHADLYVEAIPADTAMQSRVIGPYQFSPHGNFSTTQTLHDYELTVDPGSSAVTGANYHSLIDAYAYLQIEQATNPRITILAPDPDGSYDIARGHWAQWGGEGYCTVEAAVPVTIGKNSFVDLANAEARPFYTSLHFKGANIMLDFENMDALYGDSSNTKRKFWFDRVRIMNGGGRNRSWQRGPRTFGFTRNNAAWITDCRISDMPGVFNEASLARGNIVSGGYFDCANHAHSVVANRIDDWDSAFWTSDRNALSVQFSGSGSATLAMSGGNDANSKTLTAKVNGATVGTFTVTKGDAAVAANTHWKVSHVAAWLNTLPGWSATTLNDSLRAVMLGSPGRDGAFDTTTVSNSPVTFVTQNGKHADFWQLLEGAGSIENIVVADNIVTNFAGQKLFLSAGSTTLRDAVFVNNAFGDLNPGGQYEKATHLYSQLARSAHSHVMIAHNSLEQGFLLRPENGYAPDSFCILSSNACRSIDWQGEPQTALTIGNNHLFAVASAPAGAVGTTIGGTAATVFADVANGDFSPRAELAQAYAPPVTQLDTRSEPRGSRSSPGANTKAGLIQLNAMQVTADAVREDALSGSRIASLVGASEGSFLGLLDNAGGRFAVANTELVAGSAGFDIANSATHHVIVRETLVGAANSPRDTKVEIAVTAPPSPTLQQLSMSNASIPEDSAPGAVVGSLSLRSNGSNLEVVDDAGGRFALSGTSIVRGVSSLDFETASSHDIVVREHLAGATNSPRDTNLTIVVTDVPEQSATDNFVVGGTTGYAEVLSPTSFRVARNASGLGRVDDLSLVGTYEISMILAPYDGPVSDIASIDLIISDAGNPNVARLIGGGSHTFTATFQSGLRINPAGSGKGAKATNLIITQL